MAQKIYPAYAIKSASKPCILLDWQRMKLEGEDCRFAKEDNNRSSSQLR
jgi:hypothetical protein